MTDVSDMSAVTDMSHMSDAEVLHRLIRAVQEWAVGASGLVLDPMLESHRQKMLAYRAEVARRLAAKPQPLLRHTDECMAYAARTGKAYCIGPCGRLRSGEITAAQYEEEVKRS